MRFLFSLAFSCVLLLLFLGHGACELSSITLGITSINYQAQNDSIAFKIYVPVSQIGNSSNFWIALGFNSEVQMVILMT